MSATRELKPVRGEVFVENFHACMGDGGPVWCCAVRTKPYGVPCDYKASKTIHVATERRSYPVCGTHAGVFERTWVEVIESAERQRIGERYKSPPRGATEHAEIREGFRRMKKRIMTPAPKPEPELWLEFMHSKHLCGLCGNSGVVTTCDRLKSPAGVRCGVVRFCICPNGRAMLRNHGAQLTSED